MTIIDTSTSSTATAYSNQRKIDRCQNGVLWSMFDAGGGALRVTYSTDNGATWAAVSAIGPSGSAANVVASNASLFMDVDDYAHVVWKQLGSTGGRTDGYVYYVRGTPNAARTAWTWSTETLLLTFGGSYDVPDIVAHREGTGWTAHVVASNGGPIVKHVRVPIGSSGTVGTVVDTTIGGTYSTSVLAYPSIDFNHTGDGKTIAGSTPHLYAAWSAGATGSGKGIRFKRATYSAGSWTWGTERGLDESNYAASGLISSAFDGTRAVVAYCPSTSLTDFYIRERDAADTATSSRTATNMAGGNGTAVSVTYDGDANIHLWAVTDGNDDLMRIVYDRAAGTWDGTWTTVAAADVLADTLSVKRGYSLALIEAVYTTGTVSPYDVTYASLALNSAPTASTWVTSNNQARDVDSTLTPNWNFNDPDDGDTQGSYALRRQIGSGAYAYWNAATSTWGASEVQNTSATSAVTLASGWGADADDNHKYAVKTWDAAGLEGSYSSELTVIPSAKDNPTISSPADGGTVAAPTVTVEWSAATQTAYKARLLDSGGTRIESSGWVTSTSTSYTFSKTLDNSTTYQVEVTTKNDEGLASDADTNTFSTSFTPPATPTLVTSEAPTGAVTVTITNPGTGAAEDYNDLYVRVASGGSADGERPVGGDGIRIARSIDVDGTKVDYAAASGTSYEYLVRAFADSGATADSAWTA